MNEPAQRRKDEAERLLNEPMFKDAMAALESEALEELLRGPPAAIQAADHDQWRRERIDRINTVRRIPELIKVVKFTAEAETKPRGALA